MKKLSVQEIHSVAQIMEGPTKFLQPMASEISGADLLWFSYHV